MHELAICQDLMQQVETIALQHDGAQVVEIHLQIGPLSGVEAHLLQAAFSIARAGTVVANAELSIESMPVLVKCKACGEQSEVESNRLLCSHCGNWQTRLISGDEMLLKRIELEQAPCVTPAAVQ